MTSGDAGPTADESRGVLSEVLRVLQGTPVGGLPVVTVSWARSVTGAIAAADGSRTTLSGPEALVLTHRLRAIHKAILVGIQTVLSDDPLLSVRLVDGAQPQPVVLDSRLRFPLSARLLSRADKRPWIFHAEEGGTPAMHESGVALARGGCRLFPVRRDAAGLDLREVLASLLAEGVDSLMVEGGARVLGSFLAQGLASQAVVTISPSRIEGIAGPPVPDPAFVVRERCGNDLVVWGDLRARSSGRFARG
jgi:GTP cyclohydrolase II